MNPKAVVPLIAGLGLAGFAVKLGWDQIRSARAAATESVRLWAPVQTIERGTPVNPEMLKEIEFPARLAPPGSMVDKTKIAGRVPMVDLSADLPVLSSMLLPPGASHGIIVPEGLRAVAVKVDESSGVDNHLQPGCWVDVIGMFTVRIDNKPQTIAKTIIENAQVAAVGSRLGIDKPTPGEKDSKKSEKPARAVTLLLQPGQVPVLHLAEQRGKIKLSLRNNVSTAEERAREEMGDSRYAIDEDELLMGRKKEEEPAGDGKPGFVEQLAGLFQSFKKTDQPPAEAAEAPQVAAAPKPEYVWTMSIYNGNEKTVLGWTAQDPTRPVELTSDGPNIFEQDGFDKPQPVSKPKKAKAPAQPTDKQRKPAAQGSDPNDVYKQRHANQPPGGPKPEPLTPGATGTKPQGGSKEDAPADSTEETGDETKELFE